MPWLFALANRRNYRQFELHLPMYLHLLETAVHHMVAFRHQCFEVILCACHTLDDFLDGLDPSCLILVLYW
jgi:hypothetical protein